MSALATPKPLRVALRPARPEDAVLLHRWRAEASVRRFQPLADATIGELRADLIRQRAADLRRQLGDRFQWIVLCEGEPAGWITLAITSWEHGVAEVGYALGSRYQGQGIMVPALAQLLDELFSRTALERVEARCSIENVASQSVLERLGFMREGLLRGYFELGGRRVDNYLYALLRRDARPHAD